MEFEPNLVYREFQRSQGYAEKPSLEKNKQTKQNNKKRHRAVLELAHTQLSRVSYSIFKNFISRLLKSLPKLNLH